MRATAAGLVALLVVGLLLSGVAAGAEGSSPICDPVSGENVVAALPPTPGADTLTGTAAPTFYAGTAVELAVCSDHRPEPVGTAWNLSAPDGLRVVSYGSNTVTVEVTARSGTVTVGDDRIERKQRVKALSLSVVEPSTAEVRPADGASVTFPNRKLRDDYEAQEEAFYRVRETIRANLQTLNESETAVADGGSPPEDVDAALARLNASTGDLDDRATAMSMTLLAAANRTGDPDALAGVRSVESSSAATEARVRAGLQSYRQTLAAERRSAVYGALESFGLFVLPGLALGAVLGAVNPRRHAKKATYDSQYTVTDIERSAAYPAVVAGALLLLAGVGLLVALGVVQQLIGVLI
ncbi:MAG: hypothetical protein ABEJ22_01685 [Haloferacaceae archaeon]